MAGLIVAQAQEAPADAEHAETPVEAVGDELHTAEEELHAATELHADDHGSGVFPPFDPATFGSQLLWLAITFAALYLLMSKVALPQIGGILADRKARVDADLKAADESRQKTDAAIAAYEEALASAKAKAQGIASETRDAIAADLAAKRAAVEADLSAKVGAAEASIAGTKTAALAHVDEIAAETAQAVVSQLVGEASPEAARSAVAKVKE
jgi:F-type H+-transporting ATPase subunit b